MLHIIKILAVIAIGFAALNPTFSPKAEDASCNCKADADT